MPLARKWGHLVAPKLGPRIERATGVGATRRPHFWPGFSPSGAPQATAVWTCRTFLREQVPQSLAPLRVNFEKTAMHYFYGFPERPWKLGASAAKAQRAMPDRTGQPERHRGQDVLDHLHWR